MTYYRNVLKFILIAMSMLILMDCSTYLVMPNSPTGRELINAAAEMGPEYSNPRMVEGELVVNIYPAATMAEDSIRAWNIENGIPADTPPTLLLWSSDIVEHATQKPIWSDPATLLPHQVFTDSLHGNQILFWDLSDEVTRSSELRIQRSFNYYTYDFRPEIDPQEVVDSWPQMPEEVYEQYTVPERFLEYPHALQDTAWSLIQDADDPVAEARLLFEWVRGHMTYVYPPEERGALPAFLTGEGDCGQYSNLYIALCRSVGIPARQQSGFNFHPAHISYHVWSEIYLPPRGWVPVDATRENGFLFLDNRRLIASVGMNIPLKGAPEWANYDNSEVEGACADFMQLVTIVRSGLDAHIETQRNLLSSKELHPRFSK